MAWRDELREASFRGARFFVERHERTSGRRGPTHEYADREEPFAEDTGRRARSYSVEGYVIGPDYPVARDALRAALDLPGPGTLVHPYLGALRVVARRYRIRESTREGGLARLSMDFDEAGANRAPVTAEDALSAAASAADGLLEAAEEVLEEELDASFPAWVVTSTAEVLTDAFDAAEAAVANFVAPSQALDDFRRSLDDLRARATELVQEPATLLDSTRSLLQTVRRLPAAPRALFGVLVGLGAYSPDAVSAPETTETRQREGRSRRAIGGYVRRVGIAEAARLAPQIDFESRADAAAVRRKLVDVLAAEIDRAGDAGDDAGWTALSELLATTTRVLRDRGATLARVRRIELEASQPALVLAHDLYADAGREAEIVARNGIRHPGFVPGGVELEVLTADG